MDMPIWSDLFLVGDDAIDSSHRDIMSSLAAVHGAVAERDYLRAERMIDSLSDACSIHSQSEDETFAGNDHCFPHEMLDDLVVSLRVGIHLGLPPDRVCGTIRALGQALVSDIHADRYELARAAGWSAWADASHKWLRAAGE